eukprot:1143793-Pelagomonas_calceolata.AAC.2
MDQDCGCARKALLPCRMPYKEGGCMATQGSAVLTRSDSLCDVTQKAATLLSWCICPGAANLLSQCIRAAMRHHFSLLFLKVSELSFAFRAP